jgi:copper chaperone CopZ
MNLKKSALTLSLVSFLFYGCQEKVNDSELKQTKEKIEVASSKSKKKIAAANLQTATFTVQGMTCPMGCAKAIQEDLTGLNGVQEAKVDFETKIATVTFDKTILNPEKLTVIVEAAADGKTYSVKDIKI